MNTANKKQNGFTIIEVVLVLAIAGLIFLMVFVALPSLQRGQRDTQRKNDISRVQVQMTNYLTSTRGSVPDDRDSLGGFVEGYLKGTSSNLTAGDEYKDPNGNNYVFKFGTPLNEQDKNTIGYYNKSACKTDGTGDVDSTDANRDFALLIKLENQTAPYCIDNKS
ncbi:hypothetical protein A2707_05155 [Candidatus Saccharibacteria bacterium RIFCSPHIGHO2_01_FULL_45_15]|jgi:prepilin-type N-terminal cleavage/methylation domain-containing protein|nr:MAG: hypothetical protein A2707_05155 [Candidatus Saccharibacteria bacterium RIFCSPHIGHO2_01_FULL_45_15]OGL27429.1 MAG: hypothetical protein A3C39_05335 [Candidatus Saccharibacteria bacterium RIFCSPHIGHO2_02_FULL_46_12]OGL32647.1 MAG: hypothetical protein A3E76_04810 [Candidatus Saccharibacteria bacterium RIFCSPHIGHO2_12_FULL_44_22]